MALLDQWSLQWTWRGRQRAIGAGAYERYCTLGLYAFGGNAPNVSKASSMKEACIAVNRFMRHRFPHGTWTSIAVLLNPRIGLHRDMQNMVGKLNHAVTLGTFNGGRVWIEDEEGTSIETTTKNGKVRELKGTWIDIHDKPRSSTRDGFIKLSHTKVRRIFRSPSCKLQPCRPHSGPEVFAWTLRALSGVLKASSGATGPRFGPAGTGNE